jgi:hypothetical protein
MAYFLGATVDVHVDEVCRLVAWCHCCAMLSQQKLLCTSGSQAVPECSCCKPKGFKNKSLEVCTHVTSASRVSESFCQQPGGLDCDGASRGLPWRQQAMLEKLQDLQGLKGETAAGDKSQTEQFLLACLVLYSPRASFSSPALPCHLCATAQNLRARWLKAPTTSILVHQRPTHMTTDKDLKHLQGRQPAMLSALDTWLGCCYRRFG